MIIKELYKKMYHGSCNSEDWSKDCCKISFTGINYILNYNKIEKKSRYFNISVFYFCFHFYKYKNCIYCAYRFIPKYLCYSIWTLFPLERHITWSVQQIFNILLLYSYTTSLWCLLCCTVFQKKHLHPVGDEETDRSRERDGPRGSEIERQRAEEMWTSMMMLISTFLAVVMETALPPWSGCSSWYLCENLFQCVCVLSHCYHSVILLAW